MKIVVTGASGQLGKDIVEHLKWLGHDVYGLSRQEMDITDLTKVNGIISFFKPSIVIHSAAYTQVDQAETDADRAFQINAIGSRNIAMAIMKVNAKLIYISTDYVFDGRSLRPYTEYDPTNPESVYGKSKLAGEEYIRQWISQHYILRTSWVFGANGNNFVKTMLKLASERETINVVDDQFGSPTYTKDLSEFIGEIINTECYGTYHVSNSGMCSWYEFARAIFELSGNEIIQVNPVATSEFLRPAPRPSYTVMEHMGIRLNGLHDLRHWKDALWAFLNEYNKM